MIMKNSRFLSVFLAAVLLFCAVTPAFAADGYTDEKESRWFAAKTDEAVRFCPENRKINSETEPPAQNPKV